MTITFLPVELPQLHAISELETALFGCHGYPAFFLRQAYDCWRNGFIVAQQDNQVVGYTLIVPKAQDRHLGARDEAWMLSLAIDGRFQGQGIAKQLVKHALQRCDHYQSIYLTVSPDNLAAISIYRSVGFEVVEQEGNYFADGQSRLVMKRG